MMVFRYRMTSAEMWARSVAPSVYSVYMIRRSWSTLLKRLSTQPAQAGDQQADEQLRGARAK